MPQSAGRNELKGREILKLARDFTRAGDHEKALESYERLAGVAPKRFEGPLGAARVLLRLRRIDEALERVDALLVRVKTERVRLRLAEFYLAAKDPHTALCIVEPIIAEGGRPGVAFRAAVRGYAAIGDRERASALAEEWARTSPNDRFVSRYLASTRASTGDFEGALESLTGPFARAKARPVAVERMKRAAANQAFVREHEPVELISLGQQCFAWTMPNRWGLRNLFWLPDRRLPFNQSVHQGDSISDLLASGFAGYLEPEKLKFRKGSSGRPLVANPTCRVVFNHEDGRGWVADGGRRLIEEYRFRIDNLRSLMKRGRCIYIVCVHNQMDLGRLVEALSQVSGRDDWRLLVLDFREEGASETENIAYAGNGAVVYRHLPFPSENYVWHRSYDTPIGLAYEGSIAEIIRDMIVEIGGSRGGDAEIPATRL